MGCQTTAKVKYHNWKLASFLCPFFPAMDFSHPRAIISRSLPPNLRHQILEFLIRSSLKLNLEPIVKYTALSFFADRFLPTLQRKDSWNRWLLDPLRESNLQLFALISIWIASKIHNSRPISVKSLKSLGDVMISDQHFATRDFVEAELVFMEVLRFNIGASSITFVFLEDFVIHFRELSKVGELVSFHVCTEIMDLLYETEETATLFNSPYSLAASILVVAYIISVPKQQWEFPLLPWVKFVTSYDEEYILEIVQMILEHIFKLEAKDQRTNRDFSPASVFLSWRPKTEGLTETCLRKAASPKPVPQRWSFLFFY